MLDTSRYAEAIRFAAEARARVVCGGPLIPAIAHPLAVAALAAEFGGDEDQVIAGLLHDVIDVCGVRLPTLSLKFGRRVASIVEGCTDVAPSEPGAKRAWRAWKEGSLAHLEGASQDILFVSACDKLHGARVILADVRTSGADVFDRLALKPDQVIWYYRSVTGVFARRLDHAALVSTLIYEVANMWDLGLETPAGSS